MSLVRIALVAALACAAVAACGPTGTTADAQSPRDVATADVFDDPRDDDPPPVDALFAADARDAVIDDRAELRDASTPEASLDVTAPDVEALDAATLDVTSPDVTSPDVAAPDVTAPDTVPSDAGEAFPCVGAFVRGTATCERSIGDALCAHVCGDVSEVEPNDDGSVMRYGSDEDGNDFSSAAALRNGTVVGPTVIRGSIGVVGDEDTFALTNLSTQPRLFVVDVIAPDLLSSVQAVLTLRDADHFRRIRSDCVTSPCFSPNFTYRLAAGETKFLHIQQRSDGRSGTQTFDYVLRVAVCGDYRVDGYERCDVGPGGGHIDDRYDCDDRCGIVAR